MQAECKSSSLEFAEAPPKILQKSPIFAEIAQLVEHNLAKVGVASPSLVFRSMQRDCQEIGDLFLLLSPFLCIFAAEFSTGNMGIKIHNTFFDRREDELQLDATLFRDVMVEQSSPILPAEWYPQSGVQLTWPHKNTDWAYMLDEVQA